MYDAPVLRQQKHPVRSHTTANGAGYRVDHQTTEPSKALPLKQTQMKALRKELGKQDWLDNLMAEMKAAGSDTRVRILYLLWRRGEVCVNDLASVLELTTPAISQQLKKLRENNLVVSRRDRQTVYYRLNDDSSFIQTLMFFFEGALY